MSASGSSSAIDHGYLPKSLKLPHYVPNTKSTPEILTILSAVAAVIVCVSWVISGRRQEPFCLMRKLAMCWFMLCAFIHTILEGYFVVYNATLAGHSTILGEAWKEYSRGDSRYLSQDTFTVCMEGITAVIDGPLAFITFFAFMKGNNYRYAMQLILSLCQLYGCSLYFLTAYKENFMHGPTDHFLYFYIYFIFLNMLWVVIPILLIIDSCLHIAACQKVSDFYIDECNAKQSKTAWINNDLKKLH